MVIDRFDSIIPSAIGSLNVKTVSTALVANSLFDSLPQVTSRSQASDLSDSLRRAEGTFTFNNGQLTSNFTSSFGDLQQTFNLAQLGNEFANSLRQVAGTVLLNQGVLTSNLSTPSGPLQGTLRYADLIGDTVNNILDQVRGTFPFSNGQIPVDSPTALGDIRGTIGFGNGLFSTNLTTPIGDIVR
jgi:hypothetical protein